ncbi:mobile mystery protein B [Chlorobium ferrooxidans]|uniref:Filamentation induced by cAMP protein Fic n=1 Tax=Chlorobium ferrooxidans DSM 13031 TaxID=377431 RepID=Q0YP18_9CHLB|nr:mobile mystery protein B [Chlorobium ferrooxidans]EAT58028.1 Filamentation induced by cAMP protein Fic [Chlorobium ferrooxidans DSM 13031]
MGLGLDYIIGQTPLDEDEKDGLLIPTIATRGELDEFEQQNIEQAVQWSLMRNFKQSDILSETFVRGVHRRMFKDVWAWAGEFRKTNKNIGVDKWLVPIELKNLLDDVIYWIEHNTYPPDEIAVRYKHRLVSIHCFPNGNGRHSRLMADIIVDKIFKRPVFSWGASALFGKGDSRAAYLKALKAADNGDYSLLLTFARS